MHWHCVSALIDSFACLCVLPEKPSGPGLRQNLPNPFDAATNPEDVQTLKGNRRQPAGAMPPTKTGLFFAPMGFLPGTTGLMPGLEFSTRMVR